MIMIIMIIKHWKVHRAHPGENEDCDNCDEGGDFALASIHWSVRRANIGVKIMVMMVVMIRLCTLSE